MPYPASTPTTSAPEHHISNAWELADRQSERAFAKFEGTGFQGFIAFLALLCLAGIFGLVGFGCWIAATAARDVATNTALNNAKLAAVAEKVADVHSKQDKADSRGDNAFRMMSKVPEILDNQTELLKQVSQRQGTDEQVNERLLKNQELIMQNQKLIIECLQKLSNKVDGSLSFPQRRGDGGEEKGSTRPVRGGQIGPLGAGS